MISLSLSLSHISEKTCSPPPSCQCHANETIAIKIRVDNKKIK